MKTSELLIMHGRSRMPGGCCNPCIPGHSGFVPSRLRPLFLCALLFLTTPVLATGPGEADPNISSSSIQGVVTVKAPDGQSTALEGITVNLRGSTPGAEDPSALTDEKGHYEFDHLSAGSYLAEVRVEGFEPFSSPLVLGRGELRVENVILQIAVVVQKVEVQDQAAKIATAACPSCV